MPLTRWSGEGEPRGIVLALHGFSEHRGVFFTLGPHLAAAGYRLYAYDQRGFGETATRGFWPGRRALVGDARAAYGLLRQRYPDTPIHLLGHSMGGAIATLAVTGDGAIRPASTILVAPAVHGWDSLPWIQRVALRLSNFVAPGARPRQSWGHAVADIQVTDDPVIARLQARDPFILRAVRVDMIHGVVNLMDRTLERIPALPPATLVQYGERDDIIPRAAGCALFDRMADTGPDVVLRLYPRGYHYLMRDRQRERTIADLRAWLDQSRPAGDAISPSAAAARLCD
jgi:alpha-beta hydrolase superfamily lysophospholipase